jgi:prepilin-type N-terminal cleavage/methylation domain-containing protein
METNAMKQRTQSGYSLVEVLIALAITSVVLLTVVTLFYMGRRNVYSGKQMTYAVSVGTRMMEDLSSMSFADLESNFNITDTTATSNFAVQSVTYNASATRDTSPCTAGTVPANPSCPNSTYNCTNDTGCYLWQWRSLIDASKLTNAQAGLIFTPRAPTNNNSPWTTATFVKVRAYIQWDEGEGRRRIAFFDTTKVNR